MWTVDARICRLRLGGGAPHRNDHDVQDSRTVHGAEPASPFVVRCAAFARPGVDVLDLACGRGRHARLFAAHGHAVTAVDRDADALRDLNAIAGITTRCLDLETGAWPLAQDSFGVVVVTNYLWRPRFAELVACLEPGGLLIYETFAVGHARYGRPSRPDFLLQRDELFERLAPVADVIVFEQGDRRLLDGDGHPDACVQRIACARR